MNAIDGRHDQIEMKQESVLLEPMRWSTGLKLVSVSWAALLFSAWTEGEVSIAAVLACGAVPGALYWTMGSFLHQIGGNERTGSPPRN